MAKCDWCASKRDDGMCLIERDAMLEAERRIDEIEQYKQRAEKAEVDFANIRALRNDTLAKFGQLIPQTYGEAIVKYPWITCEPHEWDNRTLLENLSWLMSSSASEVERLEKYERLCDDVFGMLTMVFWDTGKVGWDKESAMIYLKKISDERDELQRLNRIAVIDVNKLCEENNSDKAEISALRRTNAIYKENLKNQNDGIDIIAAYEDRIRTAEAATKAQQMRIDEQERMLADYEAIKADRDALVKEIEDYNAKQAKVPTSPRPKTAQEGLRFLAKWFDAKYEDSGTGTDTVQQDLRRWADDIDTKELRIKSAANLITNVAQILNVVQSEWGAEGQWSEWDQGVRDSITAWLSEYHGKSLPCSEPEPQTVHTDPPPYHPYPGTGVDR